MGKKRKIKVCTYCGIKKLTTKDHIPPQTLFSILPSDSITVPCCEDCRQGTILDDEYFRNVIILKEDLKDNTEANKAAEAMMRSFKKKEQAKFARHFISQIQPIEVISRAGLYL